MRGKKRGETKEKGKKGRRVEVGGRGNKGKMDRERREGEDNQIIVNKPMQSSEPEAKEAGVMWIIHHGPHTFAMFLRGLAECIINHTPMESMCSTCNLIPR